MTNLDHASHDSLSFINNKAFPLELYSICNQYLQGRAQLKMPPVLVSEIIYEHMPELPARKIVDFLEGKNVTALRYHRLLEINPQKAQLFIDGVIANYNASFMKDSLIQHCAYADFLALINAAIMRLFRESAEGIDFMLSVNDSYKEQAAALEGDELYGVWYRAEKAGYKEPLYLSMHSNHWLNHEKLVEEKIALGRLSTPEKNIIYEDGEAVGQICSNIKPVGYGNSDKFTWTFRRGKTDGMTPNKNKALFDALEQLDIDSLDTATFAILRDMTGR